MAAGDIRFPIIQTCEVGELDWIEVAEEDAAEPEHPAPTMKVTAGAPSAEELTPAPAEEGTGGTVVATSDTAVISTSVAASADDDSSDTGTIVVIVVIIAVVLVGGGVVMARRRSATPKIPTPDV